MGAEVTVTNDNFKAEVLESDIPVILCTGFSDKLDENSATQLGLHALLRKPLSKRVLAESVRHALDGRGQ